MKPIRWTDKRVRQLRFIIDLAIHECYENDSTKQEKDILDFQTFMEKKGLYDTEEREG